MRNYFIRMANGFCYSIAITAMVQLVVMGLTGESILLPEYAARFDSEMMAFGVELLMIGFISAMSAGGFSTGHDMWPCENKNIKEI